MEVRSPLSLLVLRVGEGRRAGCGLLRRGGGADGWSQWVDGAAAGTGGVWPWYRLHHVRFPETLCPFWSPPRSDPESYPHESNDSESTQSQRQQHEHNSTSIPQSTEGTEGGGAASRHRHGAPIYIAETAPAHLRGTLISLKEVFIVGGILLVGPGPLTRFLLAITAPAGKTLTLVTRSFLLAVVLSARRVPGYR